MKQKIKTWWIVLAVASVIVISLAAWLAFAPAPQPPTKTNLNAQQPGVVPSLRMNGGEGNLQKACLDSGGTVQTGLCCQMTGDFPNSCLIGACGCAPTSSHEVKVCQCGEGKCFDGNSCVKSKNL